MVLDPIPQSLPVHFFGSRPQPPTSQRDLSITRDTEERREKHERQERLQDRDLRDKTVKKDLRDTTDKRGLRVTKHAARERGNLQKTHKRANYLKRQQQTATDCNRLQISQKRFLIFRNQGSYVPLEHIVICLSSFTS